MVGRGFFFALVIGWASVVSGLAVAPQSANAQNVAATCSKLWFQRNSIYASMGHCFKRAKSQRCFPNSCRAPWGQLTPGQQKSVAAIVATERRLGCNYDLVNVALLGC